MIIILTIGIGTKIGIGIGLCLCVIMFYFACTKPPFGWQDEKFFHEGKQPPPYEEDYW